MEPKFNLDRPKITDEEINSNKDFGELVRKFKQQSIEKAKSDKNFLKNKKATYSAIIAGVTVICTVTYFTVFQKQPLKENTHEKTTTNTSTLKRTSDTKSKTVFIKPPVSKLNIPYKSYKLKSEQGGTITHQSHPTGMGSKIIIPEKAFVNKNGQEIIGDIEIKYREFHNQADIIASGIPMSYDSAGVTSHFESAGMFDIRGYQNDEPVFINPKKTITVEFASQHAADRYNIYELDTIAQNWKYISRDNSLLNTKNKISKETAYTNHHSSIGNNKIEELQKQIDAIPQKIELEKSALTKKVNQLQKPVEPLKPTKATAGRPKFELEVDYKEFPELTAFKNAVFEVGSENKNYKDNLTDITWSSAEISEGPKKGENYLLTLKLKNRTEKLVVYPTLSGADYEKAIDAYSKKFAYYKTLTAEREAKEQKLKEEFEAKQAAYIAEQKKLSEEQFRERLRIQKEQEEKRLLASNTINNSAKVMRVFNISNFGIHNSDCPTQKPKGKTLNPVFLVNNGKTFITPNCTYLVSHSKNLVIAYSNEPISFDPNDTYSLCILGTNGKLYYCTKETFSSLTVSNQNKIPVQELNAEAANAMDLKIALGI